MLPLLAITLAAMLCAFFVLWLVSLRLRDASIVDIFWGPGFAIIAVISFLLTGGGTPRRALVTSLALIWGARLGIHLFVRNRGNGEDYRYQAMRRRHGTRFGLVSLVTVFGFQALLLWFISLPLQVAQASPVPARLTALDAAGLLLWMAGFLFEAVGDRQLERFKADPAHRGRVMDRGLWAWTRHPNYFGDALLWWGFYLIACATPLGVWTLASPLVMTFLLMRVSGVPLLEQRLARTRSGYADYMRRTGAFFPRPPRHR